MHSFLLVQDSGAYLEHRYAGPRGISILGLNTGTLDLTENFWGHRVLKLHNQNNIVQCFIAYLIKQCLLSLQVGLEGEKASWFTEEGSQKLNWKKAGGNAPAFTWYKVIYRLLTAGNNWLSIYLENSES